MSGGIILRDKTSWIVAGCAAEDVAGYIRRFLYEPECRSVLVRMEAVGLYPGSLADFTDANAGEYRTLHEAAVKGLNAARVEGPPPVRHRPEYFPNFLERFRELVVMIADDPRLRS